MRLHHAILLSLALTGCTHTQRPDVPAAAHSSRTIDSFRFIGPTTTLAAMTAKIGTSDRDIGSGLYVYAYRLTDGSDILIGSADGSHILYVRHGQDVLFERR